MANPNRPLKWTSKKGDETLPNIPGGVFGYIDETGHPWPYMPDQKFPRTTLLLGVTVYFDEALFLKEAKEAQARTERHDFPEAYRNGGTPLFIEHEDGAQHAWLLEMEPVATSRPGPRSPRSGRTPLRKADAIPTSADGE